MTIAYHCLSCDKDFNDMESANFHVKSTRHEIMEKKPEYWVWKEECETKLLCCCPFRSVDNNFAT